MAAKKLLDSVFCSNCKRLLQTVDEQSTLGQAPLLRVLRGLASFRAPVESATTITVDQHFRHPFPVLTFRSTTSLQGCVVTRRCLSSGTYWKNTVVTHSRALKDYLLEESDLEGLAVHPVRSAYSETGRVENAYFKLDIESRAIQKWGSWTALEEELRRKKDEEEVERRRRGLISIIAHLRKSQKQLNRREIDEKAYGGVDTRVLMVKGSARVVAYAIVSNLVVAMMKMVAYVYTGSAAMLSETVHSLVDCLNQCVLAAGIVTSIRQPNPDHPYGFSRARYVYSLISAVGIFFLGAGVSVYHGVATLMAAHTLQSLPLAFSVLGGSFLVESLTLIAAIRQVRRSATEAGVTFKDYVIRGMDPSAVAVLMEDSAAVAGVFLATTSILLTHFTGNVVYDAVGSITIGGLLGAVALFLIQRNSDALVGRTMHPQRLKEIVDLLESDVVIHSVHDVKATEMGAETVRFKAEINVDGREITRMYLSKMDLEALLKEVQGFQSTAQVERLLLEHGERVVDRLGAEIDRVEIKIKKHSPDVRHVDLEII